ncbi:hypothetical protein AB0H34_47435, partial [Saccharopolyspora shandongensis]
MITERDSVDHDDIQPDEVPPVSWTAGGASRPKNSRRGGEESMTVDLGMPAAPAPVLAERRKTRQLQVGPVGVGSESPISVQSMT